MFNIKVTDPYAEYNLHIVQGVSKYYLPDKGIAYQKFKNAESFAKIIVDKAKNPWYTYERDKNDKLIEYTLDQIPLWSDIFIIDQIKKEAYKEYAQNNKT